MEDIRQTNQLRPAPNSQSMEGKWFALKENHAAQWGRLFFKDDRKPFYIVQIVIKETNMDRLFQSENLDSVGTGVWIDRDNFDWLNAEIQGIITELPVISL